MSTQTVFVIVATTFSVIFICESFQSGNLHFQPRALLKPSLKDTKNWNGQNIFSQPTKNNKSLLTESTSSTNDHHNDNEISPSSSPTNTTRIFFDIEINKEEIGRMIFQIDTSPTLPTHIYASNLIKICTGQRSAIDPKCKYVKCVFQHSPQSVEGFPQYRWTHVLCGNGRNAVGVPSERIAMDSSMASCAHSLYGGQYYGRKYMPIIDSDGENEKYYYGVYGAGEYEAMINNYGVYLTVPLVGPQRGSSSFSIVRVDESPQEWKERLLLNSAVLGILESGIETLWKMARQTNGPPMIIRSGAL